MVKCREKEMLKALAQQEKQATRMRHREAAGGPRDDLDIEMEALVTAQQQQHPGDGYACGVSDMHLLASSWTSNLMLLFMLCTCISTCKADETGLIAQGRRGATESHAASRAAAVPADIAAPGAGVPSRTWRAARGGPADAVGIPALLQ